ncbi:M20 family metallopeptidase [Nocardioidaceae bacterium SCSIO 66511]|nr:M20 family metallopeptidase [Nocardioidaceae bacterium SCSIO 66511]
MSQFDATGRVDVDVIDLARRLISAPSPNPPGDETAVVPVVTEAADQLGLPTAVTVARAEHRPNLVITLDFGPGGRHLALCGHIDTKPVGDADWSVDPYAADIDGDRLYGLGSGDMKAAIAAMLVAAGRLTQSPPERGRLSIVLAADEEDGAYYGAQYLAAQQAVRPDGMVIGEPGGVQDDYDRLHLVSRGIARMRVVANGRQGHSSLSGREGVRNAGVDAARGVTAIADDLTLDIPHNADGLAGWDATVNTGLRTQGGVGFGVLPGRVAVDTEVRLLPGMRREKLVASFETALERVRTSTGADLRLEFDAPPNDWLPPAHVPADDALATAAAAACGRTFGTTPPLSVFPGTTDATWFDTVQGVPTLPALGPGLLERAHGADEWVSIAAVRKTVELYESLARDYLLGGE